MYAFQYIITGFKIELTPEEEAHGLMMEAQATAQKKAMEKPFEEQQAQAESKAVAQNETQNAQNSVADSAGGELKDVTSSTSSTAENGGTESSAVTDAEQAGNTSSVPTASGTNTLLQPPTAVSTATTTGPSNAPASSANSAAADNLRKSPKPVQQLQQQHAIAYVTTIRNRFQNEPETYRAFLKILHTYQKEQRGIKDVLEQVSHLFAEHPDLLMEFTYFLPDAVQEQASVGILRCANRSGWLMLVMEVSSHLWVREPPSRPSEAKLIRKKRRT